TKTDQQVSASATPALSISAGHSSFNDFEDQCLPVLAMACGEGLTSEPGQRADRANQGASYAGLPAQKKRTPKAEATDWPMLPGGEPGFYVVQHAQSHA
ncbi:hypothetical protein, partial [Mesorhizobium japonicum]|uniref:hypothetical protein n=1 Tax=Mesorhizobium japonicum TaxID=2066070 RepID=UPI003B5A4BBD